MGVGGDQWRSALGANMRPWDPTLAQKTISQNSKCRGILYICKTLNMGCTFAYRLDNGHEQCFFFFFKLLRPSNLEKLFMAEGMALTYCSLHKSGSLSVASQQPCRNLAQWSAPVILSRRIPSTPGTI